MQNQTALRDTKLRSVSPLTAALKQSSIESKRLNAVTARNKLSPIKNSTMIYKSPIQNYLNQKIDINQSEENTGVLSKRYRGGKEKALMQKILMDEIMDVGNNQLGRSFFQEEAQSVKYMESMLIEDKAMSIQAKMSQAPFQQTIFSFHNNTTNRAQNKIINKQPLTPLIKEQPPSSKGVSQSRAEQISLDKSQFDTFYNGLQGTGGPQTNKHKKNLTQWDVVALNDSYKAQLDDQNKQLKLKQQQLVMKDFLEKQLQEKQLNQEMLIQLKQKEKVELDQNVQTRYQIELQIKEQKHKTLREVSNENISKHQQHKQLAYVFNTDVNESLVGDYQKSNLMLGEFKEIQKYSERASKERLRDFYLNEIKQQKESTNQFKEKEQLDAVKAMNSQLQYFQERDQKLLAHHKKIELRDQQIQNIFQKPEVITLTKLEGIKDKNISQIIQKQAKEVQQKEYQKEREHFMKKHQFLQEVLQDNTQLIKEKEQQKRQTQDFKTFDAINNARNQFIFQDVQDILGQKNREMIRKLNLKKDLENQIKDKERIKDIQRVYLDKKQLATNTGVLRSLSPEVVNKLATKQDYDSDLDHDEKNMESEINRLHLLLNKNSAASSDRNENENSQPPLRVRQEQLYMFNTKTPLNYKLQFFNHHNKKNMMRNLIAINEKEAFIYEANNNQFVELDPRLKRYQTMSIASAISSNSDYICFLLQNGEIIIYYTHEKQLFSISGYQTNFAQGNFILYLSDDLSSIVIRMTGQDYFLIWNRVREQQIQAAQNNPIISHQRNDSSQKANQKQLFRSNSYDRRDSSEKNQQQQQNTKQQNQISDTIQIRGSWNKIFMSEFGGPLSQKQTQFQEAFDIKFIQQERPTEGVRVIQTKIYNKQDYFGNSLRQSIKQLQQDEMMVVEIATQCLRMNFVNKGGSYYETSTNQNNLRSKISVIEFIGQPSLQKSLITKLDSKGQLAITILNSIHMLYCQIVFSNIETQISTAIKLFDFVSPDDCPPFDQKGKTNLFIDDVAWTNNDVFVIILFNANSFAILPRLGSSLIAIFNPTLMNISQTMVDQFQQYKDPKKFNELIIPMALQQKVQQIKQNQQLQRKLYLNPYEDSLLIYDGIVCFIMRMEFEQQLSDLFSKSNMCFYFLRFCISIDKLSQDPDILEKIPQLLTNKLPLFEFEKNAEADEEEDPGQVILTASQINPYEHGQKRMETNQSFNAEFTLDSQVVLLNLKHLLMGLRWNKDQPLNYYQWLVTVVNDCFFYFLKSSEPVYAFHALRMAESYCKRALYVTESDSDLSLFQNRNNEHHSSRVDIQDFNYIKKFFEAVHDMYDYHNTQEYMQKSTAEKLQIKYNMLKKMPVKLTKGSGNWKFQFSKNYALLVYYSLIQFRNYQAANFNILFLVFACYIMQRYLDSMFLHHLQKMIEVVYRNFQMKKKSDDYELFLGKSGKNFLIAAPDKLKVYQDWVTLAQKFSFLHMESLYEQENIENIQDTIIHDILGNSEKVEKNLSFLGDLNHLFLNLKHLNNLDIIKPKDTICKLSNLASSQEGAKHKVTNLNITLSIYLMVEMIRRNILEKYSVQVNIKEFFQALHKMTISCSVQHCTNFIDSHTTIFDESFTISQQLTDKKRIVEDILYELNCKNQDELRQILSILYFYLNDLEKGCEVLTCDNEEHTVLKIFMLSSAIKGSLRQIESLNSDYKNLDDQNFENEDQVARFQQKANLVQTIRKSLTLLKSNFYDMMNQEQNEKNLTKNIWTTLNTITLNARLIIKEEIGHNSIKRISSIFKYIKQINPLQQRNSVFQKEAQQSELHSKFQLANTLLRLITNNENWFMIENIFQGKDQLLYMFYQELEVIIISLTNQDNGQLLVASRDGQLYMIDETKYQQMQSQEKSKNIANLITKTANKFFKMTAYIKLLVEQASVESQIQQSINQLLLNKDKARNKELDISLIKIYLELSQFDKFQHQQLLISRALNIVSIHLEAQYENQICQALQIIRYQQLNRGNKQKLNLILDLAKSRCQQQGNNFLQQIITSLENVIYSSSEQTYLELFLRFQAESMINMINAKLDIKQLLKNAEYKTNKTKQQLMSLCLKTQKLFNLSFDTSFYFDKFQFQKRAGCIFGINNQSLQKFDEALKKFDEKKKQLNQLASQGQDSFRENSQKPINQLDSVRELNQVLESPGREFSSSKDKAAPQIEISKSLMRGRQLGGQMTPKGPKMIDFEGNLKLLKNQKHVLPRELIQKFEQSPHSIKRNESIEFDNREMNVAKIQKVTKRKNSVRRQFILLKSLNSEESKDSKGGSSSSKQKQGNEENKKGAKTGIVVGGHRKQNSVNPNAGQGFLLSNQRLTGQGGQIKQNQVVSSGPPPGLPKASNKNKNHQQIQKLNSPVKNNKESKLSRFVQILQKFHEYDAVKLWRKNTRLSSQPSQKVQSKVQDYIEESKNQQQQQDSRNHAQQKHKVKNQSFNLMFVKFDGANMTIKKGQDVLKTQNKYTIPVLHQEGSIGAFDSQNLSQLKKAKPFEMIKISASQTTQGTTTTNTLNPVQEEIKIQDQSQEKKKIVKQDEQENPFKAAAQGHKSQKSTGKFTNKQQYLNFIQKFKQISEKIDKVHKEANQLNQDYSKLN